MKFAKGLLLGGSLIFVKKITIVLSLLVTKLTKEKGNTLGTNCQGLVARRLSHLKGVWALYVAAGFEFRIS